MGPAAGTVSKAIPTADRMLDSFVNSTVSHERENSLWRVQQAIRQLCEQGSHFFGLTNSMIFPVFFSIFPSIFFIIFKV